MRITCGYLGSPQVKLQNVQAPIERDGERILRKAFLRWLGYLNIKTHDCFLSSDFRRWDACWRSLPGLAHVKMLLVFLNLTLDDSIKYPVEQSFAPIATT